MTMEDAVFDRNAVIEYRNFSDPFLLLKFVHIPRKVKS